MVLPDRDHQRGLLEGWVARVDPRAMIEQRPHGVCATDSGRGHQCRFALFVDDVRIGAGFEQQRDHFGVAVGARELHGRDAVEILFGRVSTRANQTPRGFEIVDAHHPMKCGGAVWSRRIDVDLLIEQLADGGDIASLGRLGQPGVSGCRGASGDGARRQQKSGRKRSRGISHNRHILLRHERIRPL
jgi:hypothetical protein